MFNDKSENISFERFNKNSKNLLIKISNHTAIISLSNVKKAKKIVKDNLKILKEYKFEWPLPKSMIKNENLLNELKKKNHISYKKKYGIIICSTIIIVAKKC